MKIIGKINILLLFEEDRIFFFFPVKYYVHQHINLIFRKDLIVYKLKNSFFFFEENISFNNFVRYKYLIDVLYLSEIVTFMNI